MLHNIKNNWYGLIPASAATKKGRLAIEFTINKDGTLAKMSLVARPGGDDEDLVHPAWDSIKKLNPLPPLPSEYKDDTLVLRFRFYYNLTP